MINQARQPRNPQPGSPAFSTLLGQVSSPQLPSVSTRQPDFYDRERLQKEKFQFLCGRTGPSSFRFREKSDPQKIFAYTSPDLGFKNSGLKGGKADQNSQKNLQEKKQNLGFRRYASSRGNITMHKYQPKSMQNRSQKIMISKKKKRAVRQMGGINNRKKLDFEDQQVTLMQQLMDSGVVKNVFDHRNDTKTSGFLERSRAPSHKAFNNPKKFHPIFLEKKPNFMSQSQVMTRGSKTRFQSTSRDPFNIQDIEDQIYMKKEALSSKLFVSRGDEFGSLDSSYQGWSKTPKLQDSRGTTAINSRNLGGFPEGDGNIEDDGSETQRQMQSIPLEQEVKRVTKSSKMNNSRKARIDVSLEIGNHPMVEYAYSKPKIFMINSVSRSNLQKIKKLKMKASEFKTQKPGSSNFKRLIRFRNKLSTENKLPLFKTPDRFLEMQEERFNDFAENSFVQQYYY